MSKLYYSISEVADLLEVNQSLLRFWEKEFEGILNPRKNEKGTRTYKESDIEILKLIYYLVKIQGLTLAGAKKKIKENKDSVVKNQEIYSRLQKIKTELIEMRKMLVLPTDEPEDNENENYENKEF